MSVELFEESINNDIICNTKEKDKYLIMIYNPNENKKEKKERKNETIKER